MGDNEEASIRMLTTYREMMIQLIQQYCGRVVDCPGDNLLAEFRSVVDAVRCAVTTQQTLQVCNATLATNRAMMLRIGINLSEVIVAGAQIYGEGVNLAARL